QLISNREDIIMIPTIINAGAVACPGTIATNGENKLVNKNIPATTTLVKPVRPPAAIPAALSTNVVVLDVPKTAPTDVAIASANKALSIFVLMPVLLSKANSSSCEKIPVFRPVPINVPIVSKTSDKLNAKIVIKTNGRRDKSPNKEAIPSDPKAAPKVTPNSEKALPKEFAGFEIPDKSTIPIGIPRIVVATIPIKIAPRTFDTNKITVMINPNKAKRDPGLVKFTNAGTIPPPLTMLVIPPS